MGLTSQTLSVSGCPFRTPVSGFGFSSSSPFLLMSAPPSIPQPPRLPSVCCAQALLPPSPPADGFWAQAVRKPGGVSEWQRGQFQRCRSGPGYPPQRCLMGGMPVSSCGVFQLSLSFPRGLSCKQAVFLLDQRNPGFPGKWMRRWLCACD